MGCNLTLQRNSDKHILGHRAGTNAGNLALVGRFLIEDLSWYVPNYTPSISIKKIIFRHFVSKAPKELTYIRKSSHMKDVTTENNWTFELGVGEDIDIPLYVIVRFM